MAEQDLMAQMYNQQMAQQATMTSSDDEYAGQIREQRVRTLLTEIDPANQVEAIIMKIRGYRYNKIIEEWQRVDAAPQISENFIGKVEYILNEELSLNTTFSNIQPADVNRYMSLLIDVLISDVVVHGREYTVDIAGKKFDLSDDNNIREIILLGIFSAVYKCLRRAINGVEARRFFGSLRMNETLSPMQNKSSNAMMDAVKSIWS